MDAEQVPAGPLTSAALYAVAERASRTSPGKLRCAVALVRHGSGFVLALDLGLFWCSGVGALRESAGAAEHAGPGVVPGGPPQLRRLYSPPRPFRRDGPHRQPRG